jgi:hypothetical protein
MSEASFGVLYFSVGAAAGRELLRSARSLHKQMPDIPIAVITDDTSALPPDLFSHVIPVAASKPFSFCDKIEPLSKTPFKQTLFLDTDTVVVEPLYEIQEILDRFDLAFCFAPVRWSVEIAGVPAAFPEPNSGVLAYNKNERVLKLFEEWQSLYDARTHRHDQTSLRKALFDSDLRFTVLPAEYNLRTLYPIFVGGHAVPKILHGRDPALGRFWRRARGVFSFYPQISTGHLTWRRRFRMCPRFEHVNGLIDRCTWLRNIVHRKY